MMVIIDLERELPILNKLFSQIAHLDLTLDCCIDKIFRAINNYATPEEAYVVVADYLTVLKVNDPDHFKELSHHITSLILKCYSVILERDIYLPIGKWSFERDGIRLVAGESDGPFQVKGYY